MHCSKCGAEIPDGQDACVQCFTPVPRPGLLSGLVQWLKRCAAPRPTIIRRVNQVVVSGVGQGIRQVFRSLADVPPDMRAQIEAALAGGAIKTVVTVRDASGHEQTYHSINEMPANLRSLYEHARAAAASPTPRDEHVPAAPATP